MSARLLCLIGIVLLDLGACRFAALDASETRIAFGSCNKHNKPQRLWPAILDADPQLWLWTGDIVYNDTSDVAVMRQKYAAQRAVPGYQRLLAHCPVDGTWDDHDYGVNDGGKEFPAKVASQEALLDFLGLADDHPRRQRQGVYGSRSIGEGEELVRVILLDTRYHRERPGPEADVLGPAQWTWLTEEIAKPAGLRVLVSSIQVLPTEHRFEKWANFPRARQRLLDLLHAHGPTVIVSGDRHIGEISISKEQDEALAEITASGMTHSWRSFPGEANALRHGQVVSDKHFGLLRVDWQARQLHLELHQLDKGVAGHLVVPLAATP